ncbi:hypothetical protein [Microbacterium gorillae]|uniref:hypothetical protein n=1 Tax=Microbacterium gorillae TaxID=1231063 RepID=UPI00058CC933|nr:hypothetical protein [Microbacterium gorillae]
MSARDRRVRLGWALGVAAALVAVAVTAGVTWPAPVALAEPAPSPSVSASAISGDRAAVWDELNTALAEKDRAGFLAHASGAAAQALARWWDGTTAIGWDTAAITPWDDATVVLGAELAFAPSSARGSGTPDAGLDLLQGSYYRVTWDDSGALATFEPYFAPLPWDGGPLHVARAEHVVLFGASDEAALIDAELATAEQSAVLALDELKALGGQVPVTGFLAAITDSTERLTRWHFGDDAEWDMAVAGFAGSAFRPPRDEPWLPARIATGEVSSGTIVCLGPLSRDQRVETFTHEFLHALHYAAVSTGATGAPQAVMEGFAEFATARSGADADRSTDSRVTAAIADRGTAAFSDEALRSTDAWIAYAAAASVYAWVADAGGDPWRLAVTAQSEAQDLMTAAAAQNPALTPAAWQAWATSR